jgi:hypothetical protein
MNVVKMNKNHQPDSNGKTDADIQVLKNQMRFEE